MAERTDKCLLFHSATGKDSIVMLDLVAPYFKEVVCVYILLRRREGPQNHEQQHGQYR